MQPSNSAGSGWLMVVIALTTSFPMSSIGNARVPSGVNEQFTIVLPEGWSVYDQTEAISGKASPFGVVLFSSAAVTKPGETTADPEALARAATGDTASFFVDRKPADKGMSCDKLSRAAIYEIGTTIIQDPAVGAARRFFGAARPPRHTEMQLGGCQGVKFLVDAQKNDPAKHWTIDVRAVSDGKVLYLFSLRNKGGNYTRNLEAFEKALASVRFLAAS